VIIGSRSYDLEALDAARGTPAWKSLRLVSWVESSPTVFRTSSRQFVDAAKVFAIDARSDVRSGRRTPAAAPESAGGHRRAVYARSPAC
jgi:hypothetical protein